jgi:hypothetical protein
VGGRAGDIGKCRLPVPPVGGGNFILRVGVGLSQKIFVAVSARQLDPDGSVVVAVEGAIDHVACQGWSFHRVPLDLHVAVVADGSHILWSGHGGSARRIIVDANLIDNQRMTHAIGATLMEGDVLYVFGFEGIDRCCTTVGEWDANLYPAT